MAGVFKTEAEAVKEAANLANVHRGNSYRVSRWHDGFVLNEPGEDAPSGSQVTVIAQFWSENRTADGRLITTVQLRSAPARSAWVYFEEPKA